MTKFQALRPMLEVKDLAEYGMRDMGLRDPNGFLLMFGTPVA